MFGSGNKRVCLQAIKLSFVHSEKVIRLSEKLFEIDGIIETLSERNLKHFRVASKFF